MFGRIYMGMDWDRKRELLPYYRIYMGKSSAGAPWSTKDRVELLPHQIRDEHIMKKHHFTIISLLPLLLVTPLVISDRDT